MNTEKLILKALQDLNDRLVDVECKFNIEGTENWLLWIDIKKTLEKLDAVGGLDE